MLTTFLRSKIGELWDVFWCGGVANAAVAMQQIGYLLFLRRLEAIDSRQQAQNELQGKPYTSSFAGHDECRWSHFIHLPAAEMFAHLKDRVFPFASQLTYKGQAFSRYMQSAVFAIPTASMLVQAIAVIEDIYSQIEREQEAQAHSFHDTHGDIYDFLLSEIAVAGEADRFRTPQHIIRLVCAMVDPKLEDRICDPACGSGGFLVGAYHHILTRHTSPEHRHLDRHGIEQGLLGDQFTDELQWEVLREKTFHGFDFDSDMARVGLMNLILHGIGDASLGDASVKEDGHERFDVVLANPPFAAEAYDDALHDEDGTEGKHETLFVRQVFDLLRVGGKAGVIVPMSVLTGASQVHQDMRRLLIEETALQGIVTLPAGVFLPYTEVAAAALVFVKGGHSSHVWFYEMQADGYSLDAEHRKVEENDIPDIIERWKNRDPETHMDRLARVFFVPADEIRQHDYALAMDNYKSEK